MEELNYHLQEVPDFLQAELAARVGNTDGVEYIDITDRYIHAINYLISTKHAPLQHEHINNIPAVFGDTQSTKSELELNARLRAIPGIVPTDFYSMTVYAQFHMESIRFLNELKVKLESLYARMQEQHRQYFERIAQEAAHREAMRIQALADEAARRAAEEAARAIAQAEEVARRIAEEQAAQQRAREAALKLAQHQFNEALRAVAHRKAEKARSLAAESVRKVEALFGPDTTREIGTALSTLKNTIELAIGEFSNALNAHGLSNAAHFEAVGKMHVAE